MLLARGVLYRPQGVTASEGGQMSGIRHPTLFSLRTTTLWFRTVMRHLRNISRGKLSFHHVGHWAMELTLTCKFHFIKSHVHESSRMTTKLHLLYIWRVGGRANYEMGILRSES